MSAEYFEARERALLGERYDTLYAAPQETAARGVTVSALRTTPEGFAARADFPLRPSPFCKAAFVVEQPDFKPGRHPYHHAGVFYSQEPSASSAAPLLGVRPGMRVLDLCAAPGGKSSQLAAALQGQGLLVSNEYVAARAEILKSNLERMGVSNAVVLNETPARIAAALPEFFDRVLVDAPCSGEGMFRKEPAALAQHCEALVKQCAELGADILDSAAAALAPGGELVYSTCTFAPEEDEGQVAAFLQRHPEFTLADVLGNVDYTFGSEGEANRTGGLPLDVSKVRRIWPCQGGEGHFMARLVKAGTPRALPTPGEYTPEEQLWLAAAAEAGKRPRAANHRRLQSLRMPAAPGGRTAGLAGRPCRAAVPAAGTLGQGMHRPPRALLHGGSLRRNISRSWQSALPWCMAAASCCRRLSRRRIFTFCVQASSWAVCRRGASCRNIICSRLSARSAGTVRN
jgi:16S rRNA C967 or C1407 C5-methylase (RsmB/RsmF family)